LNRPETESTNRTATLRCASVARALASVAG
jgi:hypothetical protein